MKTCVIEIKCKKIVTSVVECCGNIVDTRVTEFGGCSKCLDSYIAEQSAYIKENAEKIVLLVHGSVSPEGKIISARGIPADYPITCKLAKETGLEVKVGRAIDAAALAEAKFGCGNGTKSLILINLGCHHVEGSFLNDGVPYTGYDGTGADFAHNIVNANGRECSCGRKGCFDAYATGAALSAIAAEKLGGEWDAKKLFAAAADGDKAAADLLADWNKIFSAGVANIMNLFQTEYLCFSGCLTKAGGDALLSMMHEIVDVEQYARNSDKKSTMCISSLGDKAAAMGAILL